MSPSHKALLWLAGEVTTPPLSREARRETGYRLRLLQMGMTLSMPHSRPMPSIGARVHELRITDARHEWRLVYRIDEDAIVIVDVFEKRTQKTPKRVIDVCKDRLADYDAQEE